MSIYAGIIGGLNQSGYKLPTLPGTTGNGLGGAPTTAPSTTGTTAADIFPNVKNKTARLLYTNLQSALSGPPLYSENDIRNRTLGIATAALPGWQNYQRQSQTAGAGAGMLDSGFYQSATGRAKAAYDAGTQADVTNAANQMAAENQDYYQSKLGSAMSLLNMFLTAKRKDRLAAMQLANAFGMAGA